MLQPKKLTLLLMVASFFSSVGAINLTDVEYNGSDPGKKVASTMLQQIDNGAYLMKLAGRDLESSRNTAVGIFDHIRDGGSSATKFNTIAAAGVISPNQFYALAKNTTAFKDIAVGRNGNLIAVAAGTDGLMVFNKDGLLLRWFALSDFNDGTNDLAQVDTVSIHPEHSWIAVGGVDSNGTGNAAVYIVDAVKLESFNWTVYYNTIEQQPAGATIGSVRFSNVPDSSGNYYLAMAGTGTGAATKIAKVPSIANFVINAWTDDTANWASDSVTPLTAGHIAWNHDGADLKFANITTGTAVTIVPQGSSASESTVGVTLSSASHLAYTFDDKKLAVSDGSNLKIVDGTNPTATALLGTISSVGISISLTAHPSLDFVAVHEGENIDIVSLQDSDFSKWAVKKTLTNTASGSKGIAWNAAGSTLYTVASLSGKIVTYTTVDNDYSQWAKVMEKAADITTMSYVASSPTKDWVAIAGGTLVTIYERNGDALSSLATITEISTSIAGLSFSPDGNYLFVIGSDGATDGLWVYEVSAPNGILNVAASQAIIDASGKISVEKYTHASLDDIYMIAIDLDAPSSAATTVQIELRAFDGISNSISNINLATTTNLFGSHTIVSATEPIKAAMKGSKLITAAMYENTTDSANRPEVKIWDMDAFVSLLSDINTPPASILSPLGTLNKESSGFTAGTNWHADAGAIDYIDLSSDGNLILSVDDTANSIVCVTDISTASTPAPIVYETLTGKTVSAAVFSTDATYSTVTTDLTGYFAIGYTTTATPAAVSAGVFPLKSNAVGSELTYDMNPPTATIADLTFDRYGRDLIVASDKGAMIRKVSPEISVTLAQILADNFDPSKGHADQDVAKIKALSVLNLTSINNIPARDALDSALQYLEENRTDVAGAARIIADTIYQMLLADSSLIEATVKRFNDFSVNSIHLIHPVDLAKTWSTELEISKDCLAVMAEKAYAHLCANYLDGSTSYAEILEDCSSLTQNRTFVAIAEVADQHGLDAAKYLASLAYPYDGNHQIADHLAIIAFDYVLKNKGKVSDDNLYRDASNLMLKELNSLGKKQYKDPVPNAMAHQAYKYLKFGQQIFDMMGILPADKAGVNLDEINDIAWSADGKYLFVAEGSTADTAVIVFNKNYEFIKRISMTDLGLTATSGNISITTHPSKPWLVIGTDHAAAINVVGIDFSSDDHTNWLSTKKTLTNISHATAILSVRFSPDGNHIATTTISAAPKVYDVTDSLEDWSVSSAFGTQTLSASPAGNIAWKHDSSGFALITNTTEIYFYSSGSAVASGFTPASTATELVFNHDSTKLAVSDTGGDLINIVNTISDAPANWSLIKSFNLTTGTLGKAKKLAFHPTEDLLAVSPVAGDVGHLLLYDLRDSSSSKWARYQKGNFASSVFVDKSGESADGPVAIGWNQKGTRLAVGLTKQTTNITDSRGNVEIFKTGLADIGAWPQLSAEFNFAEGYRLSGAMFEALKTNPSTTTAAEAILKGTALGLVTDLATLDTALQTAFGLLDFTTNVPVKLTRNVIQNIEETEIFGSTPAQITDHVESAALASVLVGLRFAEFANGITDNTTADLVKGLLASEDIGIDTVAKLPFGSFKSLRGDRIDPEFYAAAGTYDASETYGDTNGPGPSKTGALGAGEFGSKTSTLHGVFHSKKAYLDALVADVMAPTTGLIADNYTDGNLLNKKEQAALARAIVLRTLMSGDEAAARNYFKGSGSVTVATIAAVVKQIVNAGTGTLVLPSDFDQLSLALRQEIAAIAILYGDQTHFILGTNTANINAIINTAFNGATYITLENSDSNKVQNALKEMALISGLGAVAAIVETVPADQTPQIGSELARGLLKGEQIRGLINEDFGTAGQDGICADLSEPLMAAVVGIISLEIRATKAIATADSAKNVGSYAASLAYDQLFNDSLYRAIAKVATQYGSSYAKELVLLSNGTGTAISDADAGIISNIAAKKGMASLSRRRAEIKAKYEAKLTMPTAPAIDKTVNAAVQYFVDILKNPTAFELHVTGEKLFSSASEPRAANYGDPVQMAKEIGVFAESTDTTWEETANAVYNFIKAEATSGNVAAASANAERLRS